MVSEEGNRNGLKGLKKVLLKMEVKNEFRVDDFSDCGVKRA